MRLRMAGWGSLGLALLAMGPTPRSDAQILGNSNSLGGGGNYVGPANFGFSGLALPTIQTPRQGTWAEVLSVHPKGWIVLQDGEGKQYPVAADAIGLFLIRWPTTLEQIGDGALVEVTGLDLGSNTVSADHADVYEAGAQKLVTPTVQNLVGFNRVITAYDVEQMNTYGARFFLTPEEANIPARTHIVGPAVDLHPLRIAGVNNVSIAVLPPGPGMSMSVSRITPGSVGLVQRGDLVYFLADDALPKTLALSELVVYKKGQPAAAAAPLGVPAAAPARPR